MEKTKREFIKELMIVAQDNIWKNELANAYNEEFGEGKDKEEKRTATLHAIEQDKKYVEFLKKQLELQ